MLEILDYLLRFFGIVIAVIIAISPLGLFVAICTIPFTAHGWPAWKRALLALPFAALAAAVLFVVWRLIRFAAGYTASSEYPLHFIVRWLF